MNTLNPPYTVEQRGARTLIVQCRVFAVEHKWPVQALAEVLPYGREPVDVVANAIASRLNWHDDLVEMVDELRREFVAFASGDAAKLLNASQVNILARSNEALKLLKGK